LNEFIANPAAAPAKKIKNINKKMEQICQINLAPSILAKKGKKQVVQSKRWCFKWNNYPKNWSEQIEQILPKMEKWVFSQEVGESGTPHIQGFLESKVKLRPMGLLPNEVHWERAKGNDDSQIAYCTKDPQGPVHHSFNMVAEKTVVLLRVSDMYAWQKQIFNLLTKTIANDRDINWIWETEGKFGKSVLCKLLCAEYGALITSGKVAEMKNQIVKYHKNHGRWPAIVLFDVPRTSMRYLSYPGVEEIKNGCFASTKYRCDVVTMPCPHVIIFANSEPEYSTMSPDRWIVRELNEKDKNMVGVR